MASTLELREPGHVSRRFFLKAGAAIGGGLMIGWVSAARMRQPTPEPFAPNAFLRSIAPAR